MQAKFPCSLAQLCRGRTGGTPRVISIDTYQFLVLLDFISIVCLIFFFFLREIKHPPFSEGKGEQPIETDLFSFLVLLLPRTTQQQKDMIQ